LLQEVFERVVREQANGRTFPTDAQLPWLYRVARNLTMDYYRRDRRAPVSLEAPDEFFDRVIAPESGVFFDELREMMNAAVVRMHPDGRYAGLLALLMDSDKDQADIARSPGYSRRTIRRMTAKILITLAGEFKQLGITPEFLSE
jgi:RNA polymerase sigma factor (sigma-70 family)